MNLKLLSLTLPTLLIASLLTGCGDTSSNPIEKYNGIKTGPVNNDKAVVQTIANPDLFSVTVQGSNEVNAGQFVEGVESTVLIKIEKKDLAITQYTAELESFANLNPPVLTETAQAGIYALTWFTPVGTIPTGLPGLKYVAKIRIKVLGATSQQLVNVSNLKSVELDVNRNGVVPTLAYSDLSKGVDEGINTVFTVDVTDPNSAVNPRLPEIKIDHYINSNTEAYRADGFKYFELDDKRPQNPERKGTTFRFYFNLLVDHLPLDRDRNGIEVPAATSVPLCFMLSAVSGSKTPSIEKQICTVARYASQPPVITFREIPELKAGHEVSLSFQMTAPHALSVVTLNKPAVTLANLSGAKVITCTNEVLDKKNSQVCVIKWTPACISKTVNVDVLVKADATLADKVKSAAMTKTLTVLPDLDLCPMPATIKKGAK